MKSELWHYTVEEIYPIAHKVLISDLLEGGSAYKPPNKPRITEVYRPGKDEASEWIKEYSLREYNNYRDLLEGIRYLLLNCTYEWIKIQCVVSQGHTVSTTVEKSQLETALGFVKKKKPTVKYTVDDMERYFTSSNNFPDCLKENNYSWDHSIKPTFTRMADLDMNGNIKWTGYLSGGLISYQAFVRSLYYYFNSTFTIGLEISFIAPGDRIMSMTLEKDKLEDKIYKHIEQTTPINIKNLTERVEKLEERLQSLENKRKK
jgi:hypothetical protein